MDATMTKVSITAEAAQRLIDAAEQKARAIGIPVSITVCDEAGVLKAFRRMDGALQITVEITQNKAYTAATTGMANPQSGFEFIKDNPAMLHGMVETPRFIVFGGGYPIKVDRVVIGGIGVGGGHPDQDRVVAEAALQALAES